MKKVALMLVVAIFDHLLYAQCLMEGTSYLKSASINNWSLYTGYDYNHTPLKYVRVTIHIFQKSNGTGNFPDNAVSREWLSNFFWSRLNDHFANTVPMALPTSSPYIRDTRIRFMLVGIYFWKDDLGWDLACLSCYGNKGNYLYDKYVVNNSDVMNKYNSLHVFMGENDRGHGRASGFGDKRWIIMSGCYSYYMEGNHWLPKNLLAHELGHSLGLSHTWCGDDGCSDTPENPNCWNNGDSTGDVCGGKYPRDYICAVASNNMMDYNANQSALTLCQINMMHYYLLGNAGNISDCVQGEIAITAPSLNR